MITKQENILKEMKMLYNWTDGTYKTYTSALTSYTEYHHMNMQELINEAEIEEETINKTSKRTIKKRLINYRLHLQEEKQFSKNTIKMYLAMIKKIYRHHDIQIPTLPPIKVINNETFEDIPTTEEQPDEAAYASSYINTSKIGWGLGKERDNRNCPLDAVNAEKKYADYDARFLTFDKNICLTFDEGYENGYTAEILPPENG